MECRTWTVVKFVSDNSVSVVPTNWIHEENKCYWPPFTIDKITYAIKNGMLNTCWPSHQISVFRNATYESYEIARQKSKKAEDTSELNTDDEEEPYKKRRQIRNRFSSSEDSDNSYVKPPPKLCRSGRGLFSKKDTNEENIINSKNQDNISAIMRAVISQTPVRDLTTTVLNDTHTTMSPSPGPSKSTVIAPDLGSARSPNLISSENLCSCCPHLKHYFKEILKQQHIIRTRLNDLTTMVEQNSSNSANDPKTEVESGFIGFNLPLGNIDEFEEFNKFLKNPEEFSKGVIQMSKMGGSNTYDFAKRVLQSVMTNELATLYSWLGRREKLNFCQLPFAQLVTASAEKAGKAQDKKLVEEAISSWLKRAKERIKIRRMQ